MLMYKDLAQITFIFIFYSHNLHIQFNTGWPDELPALPPGIQFRIWSRVTPDCCVFASSVIVQSIRRFSLLGGVGAIAKQSFILVAPAFVLAQAFLRGPSKKKTNNSLLNFCVFSRSFQVEIIHFHSIWWTI